MCVTKEEKDADGDGEEEPEREGGGEKWEYLSFLILKHSIINY